MPEDVLRKIKREDEKSSCVLKQADNEHKNVYRIDYNTTDDDKIHSVIIEAFDNTCAELNFIRKFHYYGFIKIEKIY